MLPSTQAYKRKDFDMKVKIAHLASYGVNAGDNIASYNIRTKLNEIIEDEIEWTSKGIPFCNLKEIEGASKGIPFGI